MSPAVERGRALKEANVEIEKSRLVIYFSIQPCVQTLTSVQFFPASTQPMAVAFICSAQKHTALLALSLSLSPHPPAALFISCNPSFYNHSVTLPLYGGSLTPLMSQHTVIAVNGDNGMPCRTREMWKCVRSSARIHESVFIGSVKSFVAYFNAFSCTMTAHFLSSVLLPEIVFPTIGISNKGF